MIFLDTSGVLALADKLDPHHDEAVASLESVMSDGQGLLIHNYVFVEAVALLQNRLGLESSLAFLCDAQRFTIHWVSPSDHAEAVEIMNARNRRDLSLVNCMSFVVMRQYKIETALAFDRDFETEGFHLTGQRSAQPQANRGRGTRVLS